MMRRILFLLLSLNFSAALFGQTLKNDPSNGLGPVAVASSFDYGNGWYDPGKVYVKLRTTRDGIYRVSAADLVNAGMDTTGLNPANYHLIFRGEEQRIYVESAGGQLDFIEFWGTRNDGLQDSLLYRNPEKQGRHDPTIQPHPQISLFSDSAAYFLTSDNTPGLRYTSYSNTNYGAFTPEPYFRFNSFFQYPLTFGNFNRGGGSQYDIFHVLNSDYVTGEGYLGGPFAYGKDHNRNLWTRYYYNSGNPSEFSVRVYGKSTWQHVFQLSIQNSPVLMDTVVGVYIKTHTGTYNNSLTNNTKFTLTALGTQNNNTDNNNVVWVGMKYDRAFNLDGDGEVRMEWDKPTNAYFSFTNSDVSSEGWVYDLSQGIRAEGTGSGNTFDCIVPGGSGTRDLFTVTDNGLRTPIIEVNHSLSNLSDPGAGAEFVIITHERVIASAQKYKTYRDTNTVNQLDAKVVTVDQIYDEFGYGTITPWAIKRFCKYAIDNWNTPPKFFLLWGKGKYDSRNKADNLVPTYGYPACDYEYVSNFVLDEVNVIPEVPIGRVNIVNDIEGENYLFKVIEYEHQPWEPWMKEGLFLGGGDDSLEQKPIFNFLNNYMGRFSGNPLGGEEHYFQKFNTGLISNSPGSVTSHINEGIGHLQFFGHSSANIYDVDIQLPFNYSNWHKYPLIVAFGCYGGNFTEDGKSFGEKFVVEKDRGSIGYLGNSTAGYLTPLGDFGNRLYPKMFQTDMGLALGTQIQMALADYMGYWSDQLHINHAKQLNLQGDPSLVLNYPQKPDLEITSTDVFFTPTDFSAQSDSFTVSVITHNLGAAAQDSFYLSIIQNSPVGQIIHPPRRYPPISLIDTLEYTMFNTLGAGVAGINNFRFFVDSDSTLDEYAEDNNIVDLPYLIPGNIPAIISPYEYAVVDSDRVALIASNYVINQAQNLNFIFEIDTVPEFNSPQFASSGAVQGASFLGKWEVPFALRDSQVYYWRVRMADVLPAVWATSSFKYIVNRKGWAQSRPPQFFKDDTEDVSLDPTQREWSFDKFSWELHAFTSKGYEANYRLNNGIYKSDDLPAPKGVNYAVFDQHTLIPKFLQTPTTGGIGDWGYVPTPIDIQALINMIQQTKYGDYILIVCNYEAGLDSWPQEAFDALALMGCSNNIQSLNDDDPFILFGRKGFPNSAIEVLTANLTDPSTGISTLDLLTSITGRRERGEVHSTIIGPAMSWNELRWDWNSLESPNVEDARVSLYARKGNGSDSLVWTGLPKGTYNLTGMDAQKYPWMRLEAHVVDSVKFTAPQMDHWHVVYAPAPDAIIDPITNFEFYRDTVQEGEDVRVQMHVFNVSDIDFRDSVVVRYTVERPDRSQMVLGEQKYPVLQANGSFDLDYTFNTANKSLAGNSRLIVEVNPDFLQPEQHYFNNLYTLNFHVLTDQVNPILDVTFDGKHIMDGDIVSPNTEIRIMVNDENPYLAVNDTAFEVWFGKGDNPFNLQRIFIQGNSKMEAVPAELPNNQAELFFRPGVLEDGDYSLKVQGYDNKGNVAGKTDYEITFEVINESSITNVLNYPNPFSSSTRFVYTLTGSQIPDVFEIHIYTITGRLVKIVDLLAEGDVHVGYNISDYAWDGTDEFGDKLANGVYIYKAVTKYQNEEIKVREESIDEYFRNGFGKLYIMR